MKKKLQVFISSTYIDLIDERQQAVQAVLNAGHIPAGMELFKSGSESQLNVVKKWIDESDVYMLLLGRRYGSVEQSTGKSYTQIEYEYAVNKNIPIFAIVLNDSYLEIKKKHYPSIEFFESTYTERYNMFREIVLSKMVKFISDLKDIDISILTSLAEIESNDNLGGWIKASTNDSPLKGMQAQVIKHQCFSCGQQEFLPSYVEVKSDDYLDVSCKINCWHRVDIPSPEYGSKMDSCNLKFELCDTCLLKIVNNFALKDKILE